MKSVSLLILLILGTINTCDEVDELTQFEMEYTEEVVIPSSTGINLPFNIFTPDIESNSESTFSVNDTRKDLIEEITLKKMDLTLTSPSNGDFGFLNSIEIYISAEDVSEVRIAWKEDIPSNVGQYLELETSGADIKEFIKKDEFKLRVNTVTDEALTSDHHIDIHSIFHVDAEILGQ
ncbi:hypothetical protein [Salinivirga cyanobacteriivorans]